MTRSHLFLFASLALTVAACGSQAGDETSSPKQSSGGTPSLGKADHGSGETHGPCTATWFQNTVLQPDQSLEFRGCLGEAMASLTKSWALPNELSCDGSGCTLSAAGEWFFDAETHELLLTTTREVALALSDVSEQLAGGDFISVELNGANTGAVGGDSVAFRLAPAALKLDGVPVIASYQRMRDDLIPSFQFGRDGEDGSWFQTVLRENLAALGASQGQLPSADGYATQVVTRNAHRVLEVVYPDGKVNPLIECNHLPEGYPFAPVCTIYPQVKLDPLSTVPFDAVLSFGQNAQAGSLSPLEQLHVSVFETLSRQYEYGPTSVILEENLLNVVFYGSEVIDGSFAGLSDPGDPRTAGVAIVNGG